MSTTSSKTKTEETELRPSRKTQLRNIISDLTQGLSVTDLRFDLIYPEAIRRLSEIHWTPVEVARRAAELLHVGPKTHVLDIGSGPGKFCMVAALTTNGKFTGVEQRPDLAKMARNVARHYKIPRVSFIPAKMEEIDWSRFTGFYLYNPFIETLYEEDARIDGHVDFGQIRYIKQVRFVQRKLVVLPIGTRIVTFHGFGGEMAPGYEITCRERWGEDYIVQWERVF